MNRLPLALSLALVAALPAAAQIDPAEAFPLAVGNEWEFVDYAGRSVLTWKVTGEQQTAGGERIALLEMREGAVVATCGVRTEVRDAGAFVGFLLVDPAAPTMPCPANVTYPGFLGSGGFWASGGPTAATATISDTTVTGDAWEGFADHGINPSSADNWTTFRGIGPVSFIRVSRGGGVPSRIAYSYELTHAVIGGTEYGASVVPAGDGPFERYLPLTVGTRWDYRLTASADGGADVPAGAASLTVTALTDDATNVQTATVEVVRQTTDGAQSRSTCRIEVTAYTTRSELLFTGATCGFGPDAVFPEQAPLTSEDGPGAVQIGGQTVTVDRARGTRISSVYGSSGIYTTTETVEAAAGIGVVQWTYSYVDPSTNQRRGGQLAYARVGGVEYGAMLVADEDAAPGDGALALSVGPNPARAQTTLRYTLAEAATVRVEVVDALGRRVRTADVGLAPAGAASLALDTSGLAPGVYVVRLTAGAASAAARLVVSR